MSLIDTAPERLALMAWDASSLMNNTSEFFQPGWGVDQMPFALVEVGEDSEPAVAAGVEFPVETYRISVFVATYNVPDDKHAAEIRARTMATDMLTYFRKRTQLQFSNTRNRADLAALGPLAGVRWARFQRGPVSFGAKYEEIPPTWGFDITATLETIAEALESLR